MILSFYCTEKIFWDVIFASIHVLKIFSFARKLPPHWQVNVGGGVGSKLGGINICTGIIRKKPTGSNIPFIALPWGREGCPHCKSKTLTLKNREFQPPLHYCRMCFVPQPL